VPAPARELWVWSYQSHHSAHHWPDTYVYYLISLGRLAKWSDVFCMEEYIMPTSIRWSKSGGLMRTGLFGEGVQDGDHVTLHQTNSKIWDRNRGDWMHDMWTDLNSQVWYQTHQVKYVVT
jgi:hypothetical protein